MASQTNTTEEPGSTPDTAREPILKRRRVARACQSCRQQKSRCDGQHPVCSRCKGYGHTCVWSDGRSSRSQELDSEKGDGSRATLGTALDPESLSKAVELYEKLIRSIRVKLSNPDRTAIDSTLSYIRRQLPEEIQRLVTANPVEGDTASPKDPKRIYPSGQNMDGQRYLGRASDVWFFNSIKKIMQDEDVSGTPHDNAMQSYDGDTLVLRQSMPAAPSREIADSYVEIYFSTIHIAYPFISKPAFMDKYEQFWHEDMSIGSGDDSWLSLLYTLFAIGDYYSSFPRSANAESQTYLQYFEQSLSLGDSIMTDCTLANVQTLVAQCFYLLATGQIDRCWNTLGLAIRVGQSIGLYIEDSLKRPKTSARSEERETMRRTWYSMYVLDRLVALQLGRPPAIHEDDYSVNLPSKTGESVSSEDNQDASPAAGNSSSLDYFLSVIRFSWILGQVISELYRPTQVVEVDHDEMLLRTDALDLLLSEWKLNLPRHLRFDLGHTFEQSVVFRRQRNMLAIKFHHLRALIHRPYLCLAWLQRHNRPLMALLERAHDRVEYFQRICVTEAQEIAHRLNNVSDVKSLVYDFPWWQMISCLLSASSILLVASACLKPTEGTAEIQSQMLNEDAETCLKVFDALSINSVSAKRARDMMKGLKKTRILTKYQPELETADSSVLPASFSNLSAQPLMNTHLKEPQQQALEYEFGPDFINWQSWPGELSDAIAWSAQFLHPAENVDFNGGASTLDMLQSLSTEDGGYDGNLA